MSNQRNLLLIFSLGVGLTLALLWALQPIRIAHAQTFTVTKTDDSADGVCDADCSLREAIIAANESEGPDTIILGPGHYLLTLSGSSEDLGVTGDLDITSDITIQGAGAEQTIIDAGGFASNNRDRVFHINGQYLSSEISPTVTISGVTVQSGLIDYQDYKGGGGILIYQATVEIHHSAIISNHSVGLYGSGGGIVAASSSLFTLTNSVVRYNRKDGAAITTTDLIRPPFMD